MKTIWRKIAPRARALSVCMRVCREKEHQFENGTWAVV
jgi:hypothetical protein